MLLGSDPTAMPLGREPTLHVIGPQPSSISCWVPAQQHVLLGQVPTEYAVRPGPNSTCCWDETQRNMHLGCDSAALLLDWVPTSRAVGPRLNMAQRHMLLGPVELSSTAGICRFSHPSPLQYPWRISENGNNKLSQSGHPGRSMTSPIYTCEIQGATPPITHVSGHLQRCSSTITQHARPEAGRMGVQAMVIAVSVGITRLGMCKKARSAMRTCLS